MGSKIPKMGSKIDGKMNNNDTKIISKINIKYTIPGVNFKSSFNFSNNTTIKQGIKNMRLLMLLLMSFVMSLEYQDI